MIVNYIETNKKRLKAIHEVLPKETIISTTLEPSIELHLFDVIASCIRQELEVYRKYPKRISEQETKEEMVKTFDPRNNESCFMGKGFKANSHITDMELRDYRKAIGTIPHPTWGDVTLMEIWGGDHFEEHRDMVTGAFAYGSNMRDDCPEIKVFVNPLFQNKRSKEFKLSAAQKEYKDDMDELLAKAIVFGVMTPKQAKAARKRK